MTVTSGSLPGLRILSCPPAADERGYFSMVWDSQELRNAGIEFRPTSACHSYNEQVHTLRGMHYQEPPDAQAKLIACTRGAVLDVAVDLRKDSPRYLSWAAIELREGTGVSVYIPSGCAHGFVTLEPRSTVSYLLDGEYRPESGRVLRWNDPAVGIQWPCDSPILSDRDRLAPLHER